MDPPRTTEGGFALPIEVALVEISPFAAIEAESTLPSPASVDESNESVESVPEASSVWHAQSAKRKRRERSAVHRCPASPGREMAPLPRQKALASFCGLASVLALASAAPPWPPRMG